MSNFTRDMALAGFLMMGLAFTKPSNAQSGMNGSMPTNENKTEIKSNVSLMQNKYDLAGHSLSQINDSAFLLKQDAAGATVTSRAFGFVMRSQKENGLPPETDSAMFYRTHSEVNGYTVDGQYALVHDHEDVYPNYEQSDKTYAAWNVTAPDGNVTSLILNRKSPDLINGKPAGKFLTTIIQPNGKQYLIHLDETMVDNLLIPAMAQEPEKVIAFAEKACVKKNKSEFDNPRPGYTGQELPGGTFQIISIDGSGFSSTVGMGVLGSAASERKAAEAASTKPNTVNLKR